LAKFGQNRCIESPLRAKNLIFTVHFTCITFRLGMTIMHQHTKILLK